MKTNLTNSAVIVMAFLLVLFLLVVGILTGCNSAKEAVSSESIERRHITAIEDDNDSFMVGTAKTPQGYYSMCRRAWQRLDNGISEKENTLLSDRRVANLFCDKKVECERVKNSRLVVDIDWREAECY